MDSKKLSRLSGKKFAAVPGFSLNLRPSDLNAISLRIKLWCLVRRYALHSKNGRVSEKNESFIIE